jgi:hypothetical protein
VVPCPTDIRPLVDPDVRTALKSQQALWVSEGRERGGWISCNVDTGRYTLVPNLDVNRSDCNHAFKSSPAILAPEWMAVGTWHTHPKNPGQPLTFPQKARGSTAANGPSPEDKQAVLESGRPVYVMENNEVWFISFPCQNFSPASKHTGPGAACQW